jgi:hypothetical protein
MAYTIQDLKTDLRPVIEFLYSGGSYNTRTDAIFRKLDEASPGIYASFSKSRSELINVYPSLANLRGIPENQKIQSYLTPVDAGLGHLNICIDRFNELSNDINSQQLVPDAEHRRNLIGKSATTDSLPKSVYDFAPGVKNLIETAKTINDELKMLPGEMKRLIGVIEKH